MNAVRIFGIMGLCMLLAAVGCSGMNAQLQQKQEKAARNLGEAYMMKGDYTAALRELLKAESLYPDDPYLQYDLGLTYMAKEKLDLAVHHFKQAIEIKSDYAAAKNALGAAYLAKEQWEAAIAVFEELSEDLLYATPHYPLANLGFAYYKTRDYRKAERLYLKALKHDPRFVIAQRGLAQTYLATGKTSDAVAWLEKAVKISPTTAQLYFDLGQAYARAGSVTKALHSYEKTIELSPDSLVGHQAELAKERLQRAW